MKHNFILEFYEMSNDETNELYNILGDKKIQFNVLKSNPELRAEQKYREVIDRARVLVNNVYNSLENPDKPIKFYEELLDILKEVE